MRTRFLYGNAALAALFAATPAFAEFCGSFCDSTDRAGRAFQAMNSVVAYGPGSATAVRVWVPHLLDDGTSLQNGTAAQIVDGRVMGANTAFSSAAFDPRIVISFGTARETDVLGGFTSNNIEVFEPTAGVSNTVGAMLPDGRLLWRANFNSGVGQNNIETFDLVPGAQTPIVEPDSGDPILFGDGIDATPGSVFLGTPGAIALDSDTMFVGNTTFSSAAPVDAPVGCNIYEYSGAAVAAVTPLRTYSQAGAETFANANGVPVDTGDGRQTQPVLTKIGSNSYYVAFGINDTTVGGSGRPAILVVDKFYDATSPGTFDGFTGAVAILPPTGWRFVDHQATGGGSGPFEGSHFDINSSGDVVALIESTQSIPSYAIIYYDSVLSGENVTGYAAGVIIADAGPIDTVADNLAGPILVDPNIPDAYINAISGASINDRGNIAFTATYDTGIPFDANDPNSATIWDTAAYLYKGGTLHQVLRENDVIGSTLSGQAEVTIGLIPQEGSDSMFGASLANTADVMAINFRASPNDGRGVAVPSRGVAMVAVGHIGDVDFSGNVGLADLSALLTGFGTSFLTAVYDPQADFDLDGFIGLADLSFLLTNFGLSVTP